MSTTTQSPGQCTRCHKMIIICSCSTIGQVQEPSSAPLEYYIEHDDNILDVDFLDIQSIEAQPDFGSDVTGRVIASSSGNYLDVLGATCNKRHQHNEFIDVDTFSIEHLPPTIKDHRTYVWIRNCAPLVVRLVADGTASGRACLISDLRGKKIECTHCLNSPRHMLYGGIGIITNKHFVTTDEDVSSTKVEFFYNNRTNRMQNMVTEYGTSLHTTNIQLDYSVFSCFVHCQELVAMVDIFDKKRNLSWLAIPREIREITKNFAIIISHPHGASKRISIGNFVERKIRVKSENQLQIAVILINILDICSRQGEYGQLKFGEYIRQLPDIDIPRTVTWYTTATCKGSSGAPVYMGRIIIDYNGEEINQAHTHRGVDDSRGLNNCFT